MSVRLILNIAKLSLFLLWMQIGFSQSDSIKWISFEQLEDSLALQPKKVLIDFYADWCAYCKKMDRVTFVDRKVVKELNRHFYAVRMNAESKDTINFGGRTFVNKQIGLSRTPTHEIPLMLGSRTDEDFTLPVVIILNEQFEVVERYFQYISPKAMRAILKN